ncbi:kanadaptin-like isoform X1 [Dysidea avara]|uniref:kanadaptin-like isoform X1 n=2 Tax=Dysidea avara TaxID=196820 RepID=UPI00331E520A
MVEYHYFGDLELEFETVETGKKGVHCIRVSLPVQSAGGEMVVAEATLKGKKKEAVTQCALEACRLLDSYGMLRQASQGHKKKVKNWEEDDFYSSDEDSFLDRTGTIEKKRHSRMKKMGKAEDAVVTYETLNKKLSEVTSSLQALEERLARAKEAETISSKGDSLDVYMKSVKEKVDKGAMYDIKLQINKLKKEETKLRDLVKLAQPTELPALKQPENDKPPVASKPNPNKKQYGLTKLPVDRKQAYLREMAAKPVKADNDDDECVVEYDSDDDEHGDNSSTKVDTTNTTSDTIHEEEKIISDTDIMTKDMVQNVTDDKMSGQSVSENNEVDCRETEDDQKVVSPKKRKMIGASLGPLRKRNRRRSSETTEEVTPTTQWSNDYDPDYASWLPPEDQSGDGKTHLNAKYGY